MSAKDTHHHITPLKVYFGVAGALLVLTFVTVYTAQQIDIGEWNMALAMAIALFKASLVCLYFMHLLYDNKIYAITFLSALLFLTIFVVFTLIDVLNRDSVYEIRQEPIVEHATAIYTDQGELKSAVGTDVDSALVDTLVSDTTAATDQP